MNYSATWQTGQYNNEIRGELKPQLKSQLKSQSRLREEFREELIKRESLVKVKKTNLSIIPAIFVFFALALQLNARLEKMNALYKLDDLRSEIIINQSALSELNFALEQLYQPDFIVRNAENRLGLVVTPPQRIRRLR